MKTHLGIVVGSDRQGVCSVPCLGLSFRLRDQCLGLVLGFRPSVLQEPW